MLSLPFQQGLVEGSSPSKRPRSRRVPVLVSANLREGQLLGMAYRAAMPDGELWLMAFDQEGTTESHIAQVLATLELDSHWPVLQPGFMPHGPACLYLDTDEQLVHGRGRTLARWALTEVKSLAQQLLQTQKPYLALLLEAVRGNPAKVLGGLEEGFILTDEHGLAGAAPEPPRLDPDLGKAPVGISPLHVVKVDYRQDRYMRHLSRERLGRRTEDILNNLPEVDESGAASVDGHDPEKFQWLRLFSEVISEMEIRHGPYPAGWGEGFLDKERRPGSLTSAVELEHRVLKASDPLGGQNLVKYGKLKYMAPFLEEGLLRVAPASYYDDASLDPARRDDELFREIDVGAFGMGVLKGFSPSALRRSPLRRRVTMEANTNYYLSCLSTVLSRRLLHDFEAECAVILRDRDEFVRRLTRAVAEQFPDWRVVEAPVVYFDPLQVTEAEVEPLVWKHFRYAYQREYRIAWLPPRPISLLEPFEVRLGSLKDMAEIIELSE